MARKLHNDIMKAEANKGKRQIKMEVFHYVVSSQK